MNLDELQSVQSRERQTDSLQQLRDSFYADAGEYIQQLRENRDQTAEQAADPFDSPEVNRLSDDVKTAEQTVEALYERRVGKVVKMASLAAADMPTEEDGLTREERKLFETLVRAIEESRQQVLDVLSGDASQTVENGNRSQTDSPDGAPDSRQIAGEENHPSRASERQESGVGAADVMGATDESVGGETPNDAHQEGSPEQSPVDQAGPAEGPTGKRAATDSGTGASSGSDDDVPRRTVRITDDVGSILGVDEREYDLSTDDVVTLPAANADPLVEQDAAERLD